NSEYDEAKNEQAKVEARILELETIITKAKVVSRSDIGSNAVGIGSHVLLLDTEYNEEMEVYLVGSSESDPDDNRISNESPIGEAILGGKVGETVEAVTPSGALKFKILKILE
ncbi:MAG TPA: transcription elongation factor GreA, partial [Oscillospiraceae bacterium]|nr:transcription elongation factor GreA [Oscillospiraceae bacterium]